MANPDEFYSSRAPKTAEEAMAAIWNKPQEVREFERQQFAALMALVKDEVPGSAAEHCQLTNCYAWTQSKKSVTIVVWLQGPLEETSVQVDGGLFVQCDGSPAVLDREFAFEIEEVDVDSVSWDRLDMIAFKVMKRREEKWDRLFKDDSYMLRAIDWPPHEWTDVDGSSMTLNLTVDGKPKVTVTSQYVLVECGWVFKRHFKYKVSPSLTEWIVENSKLQITINFVELHPNMKAFVEDEDGMLTGVVAEMMAFMDYAGRWRDFDQLSALARNMFDYALPPSEREQFAFDDDGEEGDIIEWWNDDDDPPVEIIDSDDEDARLPPAGMLGLEPVKLESQVVTHVPAATVIKDYAWDDGTKNVKVYVDFPDLRDAPKVDFQIKTVNVQVAERFRFELHPLRAIDPAASSFKVKRNTVILALRKAKKGETWPRLQRDAGDEDDY